LGKDELTIVAKNSLNTIATEINTLPSKGVRTPANNYSWLNLLLGGGNAPMQIIKGKQSTQGNLMVLPVCGRVSNAPASPVVRQLQSLCSKGTGLYMAQRSVQNCLRMYYQSPQRVEGGGEGTLWKCHPLAICHIGI
jgi:hypothetical protein